MRMREFIRQNRAELDESIRNIVGQDFKLNNRERETWILNHEGLYQWAQRSGVRC